jgi:hypothetical protein
VVAPGLGVDEGVVGFPELFVLLLGDGPELGGKGLCLLRQVLVRKLLERRFDLLVSGLPVQLKDFVIILVRDGNSPSVRWIPFDTSNPAKAGPLAPESPVS